MRDIDLSLFFYCRQGKDEEKMRKNGKTKETILSMAGTLAATGIGCAVFVPERFRAYAWLLIIGICMVFLWELWKEKQKRRTERERERTMQIVDLEPDYKNLFAQQLQLRIQEKLRVKFPEATVALGEKEVMCIAERKKTAYIPVQQAGEYCHISIALNEMGEIHMNLFSLVNFESIQGTKNLMENEEQNIEQWFTQKGQQLLTELITNMNSRGYSKLSINENGDVTVRENGRNVRKDHFHEIPPKESWARLRELMMDEDVQVQVSGRQLTFAW